MEKKEFIRKVKECVLECNRQESLLLTEEEQEHVYNVIKSTIIGRYTEIKNILEVFSEYETKLQWILEIDPVCLSDVLVFVLRRSLIQSEQLIYYINIAIKEIDRYLTHCTPKKQTELLMIQLRILTEVKDVPGYRTKEAQIIEQLKKELGIEWKYIGKEGQVIKGTDQKVPILVCEITTHSPQEVNQNQMAEIEKELDTGCRYLVFPLFEKEYTYNLTKDQCELLYLIAVHLLNLETVQGLEETNALCRRLLLENTHKNDTLLLYSQTLKDRPLAVLALIEKATETTDTSKIKNREILLANALTAVGSHAAALPFYQKYSQEDTQITSMILAGRKDLAIPVLMDKIKEIREKIEVQTITDLTNSLISQAVTQKEPSILLRIQLGNLLYTLGRLESSSVHLSEAFTLIKTPRNAKALCSQLLQENRTEEALAILQQCSFEVMDKERLLLTAVTLIKSEKYPEAEKVLRYAHTFNQTNDKIDEALQITLIQQNKLQELMDMLCKKIQTYSTNLTTDCNTLFTYSYTFMWYSYSAKALQYLYNKTTKVPVDWMNKLLEASKTNQQAKESFLSVLSEMKTLDTLSYIKTTLETTPEITPITEYNALKRLIEGAIATKTHKQAERYLYRLQQLAEQTGQHQDYADTAYALYLTNKQDTP
ncbi:hypothetical protein NEOKW01_1945 [Nematocida sp. AWRm80]|nr:hypothetical protein NEOKW01_1945 [Nematocida sp. AWRm80]